VVQKGVDAQAGVAHLTGVRAPLTASARAVMSDIGSRQGAQGEIMEIALSIIGGLIVLTIGADLLVRGAVSIASRAGVSPLLVGLTIVGFGTSTPELVTSVQGALAGSPGIAVGNIVGSNLFNVAVILALSAVIVPIAVPETALKRDAVIVLGTALLFAAVGWVWTLDRLVGLVFILLLASYLYYAYLQERTAPGTTAAGEKEAAAEGADAGLAPGGSGQSVLVSVVLIVLGLAMLIGGGRFFVTGSIDLARLLGVSEEVIGLTIVAAGTSMPELVTSLLAALRKQSDVALGNVLGSNIYNILGIGGVTALISPTAMPAQIVTFDNLVMLGLSVVLLVMLYTGRRISRAEGAALLVAYVGYVWWLWPA
jgi:cation:H+ antiporter